MHDHFCFRTYHGTTWARSELRLLVKFSGTTPVSRTFYSLPMDSKIVMLFSWPMAWRYISTQILSFSFQTRFKYLWKILMGLVFISQISKLSMLFLNMVSLQHNERVKHLDLSQNEFSEEGGQQLGRAMGMCEIS